MDTVPIIKVFDSLLTAGAAVGLTATAFFVMLAGYQYMSAGGSVRAVESAKGSLYNALIGFAVVMLCKIIAGLVGGALGAPGTGTVLGTPAMALGPLAWTLSLLSWQ
jgi:Type IV secretion system pilin